MLLQYLTEIINKKDWKDKYGPKIWNRIDLGIYKKSLKYLKSKIFNSNNLTDKRYVYLSANSNSSISNANVFRYEISENDREIIKLVNSTKDFHIPKQREKSLLVIGKCINKTDSSLRNIVDVLRSPQIDWARFPTNIDEIKRQNESRYRKLEELKKDPEKNKTAIAGIEKRLKEDESVPTKELLANIIEKYNQQLKELIKGKYVIVLTYDTRAIASQSTKVGWRSCMNLDNGEYRKHVPLTINMGSFIAYLATKKDKNTLDEPIARILCKSYFANDQQGNNPDMVWGVSRVYSKSNQSGFYWFSNMVEDFLNQNNKPKYTKYTIHPQHYQDGENLTINFDKDDVRFKEDEIKTSGYPKFPKSKKGVFGIEELSDDERMELYEEAFDELTENDMDILDGDSQYEYVRDAQIEIIKQYEPIDEDNFKDILVFLSNNSRRRESVEDLIYTMVSEKNEILSGFGHILLDLLKVKDFDIDTKELELETVGKPRENIRGLFRDLIGYSYTRSDNVLKTYIKEWLALDKKEVEEFAEFLRLNEDDLEYDKLNDAAASELLNNLKTDLFNGQAHHTTQNEFDEIVERLFNNRYGFDEDE